MRIIVDLDGIVVNLMGKWLERYNNDFDDCLSVEILDSWHIWECIKPQCSPKKMLDYIKEPRFFDDLQPLPGAIEGVMRLYHMGHDIRFASAAINGDSARAKVEWIDRYFGQPGLTGVQSFIGHDKEWIEADMIIDDKPEMLEHWMKKSRFALTATIEYGYNAHLGVDCMAIGCTDTEEAWDTIVEFVAQLENLVVFRNK